MRDWDWDVLWRLHQTWQGPHWLVGLTCVPPSFIVQVQTDWSHTTTWWNLPATMLMQFWVWPSLTSGTISTSHHFHGFKLGSHHIISRATNLGIILHREVQSLAWVVRSYLANNSCLGLQFCLMNTLHCTNTKWSANNCGNILSIHHRHHQTHGTELNCSILITSIIVENKYIYVDVHMIVWYLS